MSRGVLLAHVVNALEHTSALQHQLARRAALLREVATELRVGGDADAAALKLTKEIRDDLDLKVEANRT